jgi:REP element-mobilizing transposase RayT
MARQLRIQYPGAYYHVTCRGNERNRIFKDDDDRRRFLGLLDESLETYQVVLYAYVLMDNHFHLVVQTMRANLSEFMRRFNICYTGWFNYHHNRCGHLYQGRYKALLVDADNYLLELSRYIHLNPVRAGRLRKCDYQERWLNLRRYQWCSLPGYINDKKVVEFVNYDMVLGMVNGRRAYQRFVVDGLKEGIEDPFEDVQYQTILGDDDFVARVKSKYIEKASLREQPMYRDMIFIMLDPEVVLRYVAQVMGVDRGELMKRERGGIVRGVAAEMLYKYSGLTQVQIGELLGGVDYGAVYQLRYRMKERLTQDNVLQLQYRNVEQAIKESVEC